MSFQHFRLGELSIGQPIPPHLIIQQQQHPTSSTPPPLASTSKQPYGSGDHEDGYTLSFPNIDAFQVWRLREEETNMVEFVKGDTHGSKAVPPRFKDHTKLVCARHSRSGRKKYIKKHPERVRKVPSRKLEGQGCSASISYKTYFDTEEVRVCYNSEHSHAVGLDNLPYTRRGRKAAAQQEKEKTKRFRTVEPPSSSAAAAVSNNTAAGSSAAPNFTPTVSMLASLPQAQPQPPFTQPQAFAQPPMPQMMPHDDRWDRMSVLYNHIREHARNGFDYPVPSIAALESVLIRLYLESPVPHLLNGVGNVMPQVGQQVMQGQPNAGSPGVGNMEVVANGNAA